MRSVKDIDLDDLLSDLITIADETLLENAGEKWSDVQVLLDAVIIIMDYREIKSP